MDLWDWLWIVFALMAAAGVAVPLAFFAVVETVALRNDVPRDTLSAHVRKWLRTDTHRGRTAFLVGIVAYGAALVLFLAWFAVHIVGHRLWFW